MKKNRLFHEEVKDRHTSHWDLDMMSRKELETMMTGSKKVEPENTPVSDDPDGNKTRS